MKRFILFSFVCLSLITNISYALEFNMQDAPLLDLVEWVSDATGTNVIVAPGIANRLNVKVKDIKPDEVWPFFVSVLKSQGLIVSDNGLFYLVAQSPTVDLPLPSLAQSLPLVSSSGSGLAESEPVELPTGKLYKMFNVQYASVVDALKMISSSSVFVAVPGTQFFYMLGSDQEHDKVSMVLPALDNPLPRVLVEAVFMEVADNKMSEVGVSVNAILENARLLSSFASVRVPGSMLSYARADFSAVVSALQGLDNVKLLSSPSILVSHGASGSVVVGQNVPFVTGSYTDAGQNSTNPFQTIERQDVGLKLVVNPLVISSDLVELVIMQEVSNISSDTSASDLVTNKRSVRTSLSLETGSWISLGGLVTETVDKSTSGIPVLMNIPIIGGLFRIDKSTTNKRDLSVLLRVTVV